jgi:excisionase family DNA binding protein
MYRRVMGKTPMDLLTVDEAAEFLRVKKTTLYTWAYRRQIPSQKVGGALRFRRGDLDRWLKAQERPVQVYGLE